MEDSLDSAEKSMAEIADCFCFKDFLSFCFSFFNCNDLYKTALEGNKDKLNSSKRGKEPYYPPGHPSYGKQNSSFFGGQGGGQRSPKTLVPLDDGMDFQFAV